MEPLRKRLGLASRRVLIVTVLAVGLVAVGSVAATARAKGSADRMLEGTRIDGVNVSGMTRHQAMEAVLRGVMPKLRSQVTLVADKRRFTVTPAQLGGEAEASQTVDRALAGRGLSWQHARSGWSLDRTAATSMVAAALAAGQPASVAMPARVLRPHVTDREAGATIAIDKGSNQLTLYKALKVVKRYRVATAKAGFTTPSGTWKVIEKIVNPSWHNPAPGGWGSGMPLVIPAGPGNPLGTRALRLNSPGILIHGTFNAASIGTYASHGCIRMRIPDSVDLFSRVAVGSKVLVFRA